jgi:phage terminase large subunit
MLSTERIARLEDYPTWTPLPGETRWPPVSRWTPAHWAHWMRQSGNTDEQIDAYLSLRESYGIQTGYGSDLKWRYLPTPKQLEAHAAPHPNLLYGGAAGGAKSHWLRWDFYKRCLLVPNYQALILRRTFPELERTHMRMALREQHLIGAKLVDTELRFGNGALLEFGHSQDEKAVARYLSAEYDGIGVDEAATQEQRMLLEIVTRARSTIEGVRAVVRLTSNPGGAHTRYLVDRYITHQVSREDDPFYTSSDFGYIPSKLWDNPWLMDADGTFTTYIKRLGALHNERRRQLLDGDWSALEGQFFPEFRQDTHAASWDIPKGLQWERWVDWGYYPHPGVCYWVACLPDKRLYLRHEWKFSGLIAQDVAKGILEQTRALERLLGTSVNVRKTVVDPSMFNKTGHWGEAMAETFARNRVPCTRGDNDRVQGWQRVRHWMQVAPDGLPWLVAHPSCSYLWATVPTLVFDTTAGAKEGDLDTTGEDHSADAVRYGVMGRPAPTYFGTQAPVMTGTAGALLAELQAENANAGRLGANAVCRI